MQDAARVLVPLDDDESARSAGAAAPCALSLLADHLVVHVLQHLLHERDKDVAFDSEYLQQDHKPRPDIEPVQHFRRALADKWGQLTSFSCTSRQNKELARDAALWAANEHDLCAAFRLEADVPSASKIVVDKSDKVVRVFDGQDRLVAQYSATIGSASDPLPLGNWKVLHVSPNPDWKMNPAILKTVSDTKKPQIIPPGPNNPVGVVWIDLSRDHYGIHGTPDPEKIGKTESHGCVRLTNWDARDLARHVAKGATVEFGE